MFPLPSLSSLKLIVAAIGALALVIGTAVITHKVDQAALLKQQAAWKDAEIAALNQARVLQQAEDKVSLDAAVAEATAQQKIVTNTVTVVKEVPSHVPLTSKCPVTVGFVRVLNDAVFLGTGTTGPTYAPGQPDDACAPIDPRGLAASIVSNYAAAGANAEQLTALQKWIEDTLAVRKSVLASPPKGK